MRKCEQGLMVFSNKNIKSYHRKFGQLILLIDKGKKAFGEVTHYKFTKENEDLYRGLIFENSIELPELLTKMYSTLRFSDLIRLFRYCTKDETFIEI